VELVRQRYLDCHKSKCQQDHERQQVGEKVFSSMQQQDSAGQPAQNGSRENDPEPSNVFLLIANLCQGPTQEAGAERGGIGHIG
jgi:hypothetical protein